MIKVHLDKLLGERHLRQVDLVKATDIRAATISDLYNGCLNSITIKQMDKICTYLNCSVGDLFEHMD